jgi:hypothetical protein
VTTGVKNVIIIGRRVGLNGKREQHTKEKTERG